MRKYELQVGGRDYQAEIKSLTSEEAIVSVNGEEFRVKLKSFGLVGTPKTVQPVEKPADFSPAPQNQTIDTGTPVAQGTGGGEALNAPLPGLILQIHVSENQTVKAGQKLMVMEAMKMENQVKAPHDGTVTRIRVKQGDTVAEGDVLMEIARSPMSTL